jgi:hypothetical protein
MYVAEPRPGTKIAVVQLGLNDTISDPTQEFRCQIVGKIDETPINPGVLTLFYEDGENTGWDWVGKDNTDDHLQEILDAADAYWQEITRESSGGVLLMLKVTIENCETKYSGVFQTDDKDVAVQEALNYLIKHHGFFDDNRIVKNTEFPKDHAACIADEPGTPDHWAKCYGILMLESDINEDDLIYALDHDFNTYWVHVTPVEFGVMD